MPHKFRKNLKYLQRPYEDFDMYHHISLQFKKKSQEKTKVATLVKIIQC